MGASAKADRAVVNGAASVSAVPASVPSAEHTPGPWFAQVKYREAKIWRRDPADLYENGGGVAGDRALASVHLGWSGEDEQGFPVAANARLIAAAPELLEALEAAQFSCTNHGGECERDPQAVLREIHATVTAAIAKARGEGA